MGNPRYSPFPNYPPGRVLPPPISSLLSSHILYTVEISVLLHPLLRHYSTVPPTLWSFSFPFQIEYTQQFTRKQPNTNTENATSNLLTTTTKIGIWSQAKNGKLVWMEIYGPLSVHIIHWNITGS